jgi:photosystem II stability/assembly factor-like uncharacterized protein
MKIPRVKIFFGLVIAVVFAGSAHGQSITQLTPPNITFRGICLADYSHSMVVGDSASIFISRSKDSIRYWYPLAAPCDKSHTFNGVSYYDTTHAAIISDDGLIFTTTDAGEHWAQSGRGITGQTLRAITHTSKGSLLVVGDSGILLRSTDSGATWTKLVLGTTYNINAIAINSFGRGFFAGAHGLLGRTTDYGATWPLVTDTTTNLGVNREPITFRGVAIHPSSFQGIAVGDSGGFVKTTDGITWTPMEAGDSGNRYFWDSLSYSFVIYVGFSGETWLIGCNDDRFVNVVGTQNWFTENGEFGDADGGSDQTIIRFHCAAIWRGQPEQVLQFCSPDENVQTVDVDGFWWGGILPNVPIPGADFLFASFDGSGDGYATCTGAGFLSSRDNGLTWKAFWANPNYDATDIHAIDSNNAFAVGWAGGLFRTTDGGASWDSTNIAAANQERLHSIAHPAENVYVVCGDFGTVLRSTDNASTWDASATPTTNYLEGIAFFSSQIGVAVGANGTIIRTTDQGVTWSNINNQLTGTDYSYRKLQAFSSGTCFVTTDSAGLWESTDEGQNWVSVPNASRTMGMAFYNDQIGVVAEHGWPEFPDDPDYIPVNDTALFAFTTDGFATKPVEFNIPIINNSRMVFHFLDSTSFLCFGSDGFVVKVDMSQGGAIVTQLSTPQTSPIQVFPNPSATHSTTIEYDLTDSGPTIIELWNALGEKVQTLFSGDVAMGHHTQQLTLDPALHGAFFVKVISGAETKTLPIVIE